MNSSFNILTPGANTSQSSLLIELSAQGISYVAIDQNNVCIALAVYYFDTGISHEGVASNLKTIVTSQPFLQQIFKKINFVYAFAESVLVPHQFINRQANKDMMELVYGDTSDCVTRDDFTHTYNNVYRVPKQIDSVIAHLFMQANHCHLYSLLPKIIKETGNQLYCIFSTKNFTVQLAKEGNLQMIQNFAFKAPIDVAFHLLNVCERFDVAINDTEFELNGMIDADSNLYNEIYKYFLGPVFTVLPENFIYNEEIKKYPAHYFSHLFQLAACV